MIDIDANKFEYDLTGLFWYYTPQNDEDKLLTDLIDKVCRAYLVDRSKNEKDKDRLIANLALSNDEQELVRKYGLMEHPNLEVSTRFNDVMLRFAHGKDKLDLRRKASDGYLKLYEETGTVLYFVRSIELRIVKKLYDKRFMEEFRRVVISTFIHPGWMTNILNIVKKNVDNGLENPYIKDILANYATKEPFMEVYWQDQYYDMLHKIGAIGDDNYHYQKALAWETCADKEVANRKEYTFNMATHQNYQKAFNEIVLIKNMYPQEFARIRDKYNGARKEFVEILSLYGIKIKYSIPKDIENYIRQQMATLNLNNVIEAIFAFEGITYYPAWTRYINELKDKFKEEADVIEKFFPQSQALNDEGNTTGISDFEHNTSLQAHRFVRCALMYHIYSLFLRVGEFHLDYSDELFFEVLKYKKPTFIEEERVQLWAKAYNLYFNGDVLEASHLLMPQFEHALHNLLEQIVDDVTMLDNDIQKEPTLTPILKGLQPYCNPALYDELYMFFVDGNDVNYRNVLLHGLMDVTGMLRHGAYLFYVANLLYMRGKDFLKLGNEE